MHPSGGGWGPPPACARWSTSPSTARSAPSTRSTRSSAPASSCPRRNRTTSPMTWWRSSGRSATRRPSCWRPPDEHRAGGAQMSAGSAHDQLPLAPRAAAADPQRLAVAATGRTPAPRTVAALCEQFAPVCESAVDPLEIASALEFEGLGDQVAKLRYGFPDVFALAQDMYFRVPRRPAEPQAPPDPWQGGGRLRPALHSLLYALPGICFPAAVGLLIGHGVEITLIVALLIAWSTGQGLAYLGYIRLGRTTDVGQTRRLLRVALTIRLPVRALP